MHDRRPTANLLLIAAYMDVVSCLSFKMFIDTFPFERKQGQHGD